MEKERPGSHEQISNKCHQKHTVVVIFQTVSYALDPKVYEEEIREGIDDFGGINCCIVVLRDKADVSMT